ncbi:MAG TPA: DOMON-like domain-containing protein [Allosphingosinicella sp.]|nr:DOMON-like domain-containing protein [Allosphingosinicella sp.]
MQLKLIPHPATPPHGVIAVEADVVADPGEGILITYSVIGGAVVWPDLKSPAREDGLWWTTCFELFLKPVGASAYFEYNFSPSTAWAVYRFEAYRDGRRDFHPCLDPYLVNLAPAGLFEVACDLSELPAGPLRMGVSAVIEEPGGHKSYWALAHPPGDPDFHHPSCFTLELPPAGPS